MNLSLIAVRVAELDAPTASEALAVQVSRGYGKRVVAPIVSGYRTTGGL